MNPLFRNTSSVDALGAVTSTNFDVFGNVTSVVDPLNNTTSYTYNKLQQLVTENKGTDRSFSYDANGNLATLTDRNTRHSFDSAGRLKSITYSKTELGAGVNWDGTSSLPSTGTFAAYFLNYDADNRITSLASRADGFVTNFTYDAFDQRTAKRVDTDGNGTWDRYEVYTWADGQEVQRWVDTDGAGTGQKLRLANRYLWAESVDQLLSDEQYASGTGMEIDATTASGTAGTTLWALTDHLGSVRDLLDNNGVVREHNVFDSFGRLIREVDYNSSGTAISSTDAAAVDSIFGYTGRDWDSDIGMQYNRARWYDPQTGRWLSQDPIGFGGGDANLYRYVGNHPTYANDPSGLQEPLHPISLPNQHSPYVKNAFGEWVENTWYNGRNRPSLLDWIQEQEKNSKFSRPYSESGYCEMGPETQWHMDRRLREEAHQRQIERWQMIYALQEASISLLSAGRGGAALSPRRGVPIPFPPRTPVRQYPFIPAAPMETIIQRAPLDWSIVKKATGETRWEHVQKHGVNNLKKDFHGVFDQDAVLTTQEAWYRAQRLGIKVDTDGTLVVPMGRRVGYEGGKLGSGVELNSVTIHTTDSCKIITAYPTK
ncbi:RHS repeat-associated core domain-containing protein [Pirellulaceae bacterium SH467]